MTAHPFILANVFTDGTPFGGNPLAIFPHANFDDATMQAIACQFNLNETVFITHFDKQARTARIRIFTPSIEMPFAGHPTIGSGWYLATTHGLSALDISTQTRAVHLNHMPSCTTLTTNSYALCPAQTDRHALSTLTALPQEMLADKAYFVNAGVCQLLLQVKDTQALERAKVCLTSLKNIFDNNKTLAINQGITLEHTLYLWCMNDDTIHVRLFFEQNGIILEDSGTGSACVNLGAYLLDNGTNHRQFTIYQGDHLHRPNRLLLGLNDGIRMGGQVRQVGRGEFYLT
ncbi:PhzF family phenazine biosynthesis protein [Moraxella sp. K127]|uniref:PhzF family phenazine biosynthesis protein n=1 Tax=Moraxella sp. K127 TaxID=2780079 RepID=UPI0018803E1B|nr:PhzF family phenazine biosynthesis protein [Moraxella sp. K127]MBE9590124.1 PhzF family phenazine biosynthesis protein [Moraxella sp. K127]